MGERKRDRETNTDLLLHSFMLSSVASPSALTRERLNPQPRRIGTMLEPTELTGQGHCNF